MDFCFFSLSLFDISNPSSIVILKFMLNFSQKATEERLQGMLADGHDLPGAIRLLLECRRNAAQMGEYRCVASLSQKLQDTLMMTEVNLDHQLNEMVTGFDATKYGQLQEAFKLLDKSQMAVDQLHINFISQIHSTAFHVMDDMDRCSEKVAGNNTNDDVKDDESTKKQQSEQPQQKQKPLFEQLCQRIPVDRYIVRLIELCKCFWRILACHHHITQWHQHNRIYTDDDVELDEAQSKEDYMRDKLRGGQSRVWSDMQNKVCTYLDAPALHQLKFEQFIQVSGDGMARNAIQRLL